jgi:broad specificity phosphatase PhoE
VDLNRPAESWDLNAAGEAELAALLDAPFWAQIAAVYASEERKAIRVAEVAADRYRLPWRSIAGLGEVDRSATTPRDRETYEAAVAALFSRPDERILGWESASEAVGRFRRVLDEALADDPGESLAVVAHGLVLSLLLADLRGEPPSLDRWRALGFGAVAALDCATLRPLCDFLTAPYAGLPLPEAQ